MNLEGKEIVKKIGDVGEASLDVTPELDITFEVSVKKTVSLMDVLEQYVAKTPNKTDDAILAGAKNLLALMKTVKG